MTRLLKAAATVALVLLSQSSVQAQMPTQAQALLPASISVTGVGKVSARPDNADVQAGVTSQAATATAAMAANNTAMAALLATVKSEAIDEKDFSTSGFNVSPVYSDSEDSMGRQRAPKIVGYRVDNTIHIRVRQTARLGQLLDALVKSGSNTINGVSFYLSDPEPLLEKARVDAVADAKRKAELYARAAGVKLGKVLYLNEEGGQPVPMPGVMMTRAEAAQSSVPVAVGESELTSTVHVIYAIE